MGNEYRAKVFKSGNSVALRLPKSMGFKAGDEVVVREDQRGFAFEPVTPPTPTINLGGIYGSCPGLAPLDRLETEFRDLDWYGEPSR